MDYNPDEIHMTAIRSVHDVGSLSTSTRAESDQERVSAHGYRNLQICDAGKKSRVTAHETSAPQGFIERTLSSKRSAATKSRLGYGIKRQIYSAIRNASARIVDLVDNRDESSGSRAFLNSHLSSDGTPSQTKDYHSTFDNRPLNTTGYFNNLCVQSAAMSGFSNPARRISYIVLRHPATEPMILMLIILQAVILTIESSRNVFFEPGISDWGEWTDWLMLAIFICYTLEIWVRVIVSGLLISTSEHQEPSISTMYNGSENQTSEVQLGRQKQLSRATGLTKNIVSTNVIPLQDLVLVREKVTRKAYLRKSFTRVDFVAVLAFWIYLTLSLTGVEYRQHVFVFKALSSFRILRLLNITRGTSTILRSLKKAAPQLANVALFVGFFWVFMAVIGVQSFKGSFRRHCVWVDPLGIQANQTQDLQFCGGQWEHGVRQPFLLENWQPPVAASAKGFICPEQSFCVQAQNPYNGTVHFDNIFNSMELVFVIMSSNTFSDLMYYTMDSDHFVAVLFFIAGILILTFWLMSLVIAVVTTSFQVIREEQNSSAFAAERSAHEIKDTFTVRPRSKLIRSWDRTKYFWVLVVAADLATQAAKKSSMSAAQLYRLQTAELVFTLLFAAEIIIRAICYLPQWRGFLTKSNCFDGLLAIITCIIQIPSIKNSGSLYRWLTVFQIMRSYRVIQAIPFTRDLLLRILGNTSGLLNLIFFLICVVYIAALIACQLIRADAPLTVYGEAQEMTFKNIYNSFLAMYQILSSENWTTILYAIQSNQTTYYQAWIGAIFFIVWFVFGQNIVMSMFIAVLQENFEVSEDSKRKEQVRAFIRNSSQPGSKLHEHSNLTLFSLFQRERPKNAPVHQISSLDPKTAHELGVHNFLDQQALTANIQVQTMQDQLQGPVLRLWNRITGPLSRRMPLSETTKNPFTNNTENKINLKLFADEPQVIAAEVALAHANQRARKAIYLKAHPNYDKVLWLLGPSSKLRRICQSLVASSSGERLSAMTNPRPIIWYCFSTTMYLCTVAIVVLACYVTPIYQKAYFAMHNESRFVWFTWCDLAFTLIFSAEFLIKVFADGFWLTPNAYFRNTWNRIDLFVLLTLWVNLIADILDRGGVSRAFRAFKALRALRLVSISNASRTHFHDVLIAGFWNIAGAAVVSITLLIPMAVWGLNLFSGLLYSCNDDSVSGLTDCINEYAASTSIWNYWSPRSWENPTVWSFDSFGSSLLILFEIVSQEGWIDVMTSAMRISGVNQQPQQDASTVNALFFIIFNLLGAVFVLTLFIAVIIQNHSERSGIAYLTIEQRSWQEMRIFLKQVRPSRRPIDAPASHIRRKCFFAVKKKSTWNRLLIGAYCLHILLLMTEHFPDQLMYILARNSIFLVLNILYLVNLAIRMFGLGQDLFFKSRWNLFNLVVVPISFSLNLVLFHVSGDVLTGVLTAEKIFLVLVATNLITAIDRLDELFKTTASAIPDLAGLFATWMVLFITFSVAFNQIFGLTKLGPNGGVNINFRTIPKGLVLLFRMSCGEGWNAIMHDYAITEPYCTSSTDFFKSDCGSESWAYFLFIAWNIVSMYIFVNIVISLVYNNFSYVFQHAGKMNRISRDEIRRFKHTWAEFDDGTGCIRKQQVGKFLSKLDGLFEVKIHRSEFSVPSILSACGRKDKSETNFDDGFSFNLQLLNERLNHMNIKEVQHRRRAYKRLYAEFMHRQGDKVSFTAALLILAHNKFVDENKNLGLGEYLHRRMVRLDVDRALGYECLYGVFQSLQVRELYLSLLRQQSRTSASGDAHAASLRDFPSDSLNDRNSVRSESPSPSTTGRRSWRLGPRSISPSGSRRPSLATSIAQDNPDYKNLLAGSAWSTAIGGSSLKRYESDSFNAHHVLEDAEK